MKTYNAIYVKDDDWIIGWTLDLAGAVVQERTIEEARESMKEVIQLLIEVYEEQGVEPPVSERDDEDGLSVIAREQITI